MAENKRKNHIPFRLNVLFFGVFVLFSILILRLGYIQIVQGDTYDLMLSEEEEQTANIDAPRGVMFDRNNYVVVDNELQLSLTYTNTPRNELERFEIAHTLVDYLEIDEEDIESVNEREWKDYFLYTASIEAQEESDDSGPLEEYVNNLVSDEEEANLEDDEVYVLQLERLDDEEIRNGYSLEEQQAVAIWTEMLSGYNHSPNRIARGLNEDQAHQLGEVLHTMPGTDIMRDSERIYPYGEQFSGFFGSVGSIPAELIDSYVGRGYERSDSMGTSYLENEYEDVLRGEKAVMRTDADGNVTMEEGRRGNDLRLTVDMSLQQQVDDAVTNIVESYGASVFPGGRDAYVVMIEPSTGDILTMVGYNGHLGTVNNVYVVGSSIKPATILAGYHHGVVDHGSVIHDSTIRLPETPDINSWTTMGYINDIEAIRRSSNIYMAEIAMRLASFDRATNSWPSLNDSYNDLRQHYAQFGLGTETGVDLPSESTGLIGDNEVGEVLYLSFGQYDNYTPLQLAQFSATMANDGERMRPRLVRDVLEPSNEQGEPGGSVRHHEPEVLNTVDNTNADFNRMQEGMRQVTAVPGNGGGTAYDDFNGSNSVDYTLAAKTGTAQETLSTGQSVNNQTMVAYAPYDNPEIAVAVIVPNVAQDDTGDNSGIANSIAREAMNLYFEQKDDHEAPELADAEEMQIDPEEEEED